MEYNFKRKNGKRYLRKENEGQITSLSLPFSFVYLIDANLLVVTICEAMSEALGTQQ